MISSTKFFFRKFEFKLKFEIVILSSEKIESVGAQKNPLLELRFLQADNLPPKCQFNQLLFLFFEPNKSNLK